MEKEKTDETPTECGKSMQDLEYQYSPSKWCKRMDSETVIENHIAMGTTASQKARESIPYEILRYGEGENQLIDLFGTSLPKDSPLLVYIHGGYWQDLQRAISAYLVEPLFKNGIRVAIVGYDLAPTVPLDRIVAEMEELDTYLTSWATTSQTREIWYSGHSAGAYLIGTILRNRAKNMSARSNFPIRGMIFISGIYDLVPIVDTYVNEELKLTREEAQERSIREITVKHFPETTFLIVAAENDTDEFRRQSKEFHEMLVQDGGHSEFIIINEKDHFDVVECLNDEKYELTQKIINLIKSNRTNA